MPKSKTRKKKKGPRPKPAAQARAEYEAELAANQPPEWLTPVSLGLMAIGILVFLVYLLELFDWRTTGVLWTSVLLMTAGWGMAMYIGNRGVGESPRWYIISLFALMGLGTMVIVLNYTPVFGETTQTILLTGLLQIGLGFAMTMNYR
ncbi:MAG: cell division protein CrgA [Acidimicrobiia bacterium]|nr:cell division protein CrgA [Acidimicrobiia bacterium]